MFLYLSRKHALIDFNVQQRRPFCNLARFPTNVNGCVARDKKNRSMELLQRVFVFAPRRG